MENVTEQMFFQKQKVVLSHLRYKKFLNGIERNTVDYNKSLSSYLSSINMSDKERLKLVNYAMTGAAQV